MKELTKLQNEKLAEIKGYLEEPGITSFIGEANDGKMILKALSEDVDSIAIFPKKPVSDIQIIYKILFELEERLGKEHFKPEHYRVYGLYGMQLIGNNFGLNQLHDYFVDLVKLYNVRNDKILTIIIDRKRELQELETFFTPLPDVNIVYSIEEQVKEGTKLTPLNLDPESVAKTPLEHEIIRVYDEHRLSGEPVRALYNYYLGAYGQLARDLFGYLVISDYGIRRENLVKILGEIPEELLSSPLLNVTETVQFASPKIAATIRESFNLNEYMDLLRSFQRFEHAGTDVEVMHLISMINYLIKHLKQGEKKALAQEISAAQLLYPEAFSNHETPEDDTEYYEFLIKDLPELMPNIDEETFDMIEWQIRDWMFKNEVSDELWQAFGRMLVEHYLEKRDFRKAVDTARDFLLPDHDLNDMLIALDMKVYGDALGVYFNKVRYQDLSKYEEHERLNILFKFLTLQMDGDANIDIADRLDEAEALIETLEYDEHLIAKLRSFRALYKVDMNSKASEKILLESLTVFEADVKKNPTFENLSDLLWLYSHIASFYYWIGKSRRTLEYRKKAITLSRELLQDYRLYTDMDHSIVLTNEITNLYYSYGHKLNSTINAYLDEFVEITKGLENTELQFYDFKSYVEGIRDLVVTLEGEKISGMKEVLEKAIEISRKELSENEHAILRYTTCFLMVNNCMNYTLPEDFSAYSDAVLSFLYKSVWHSENYRELDPESLSELIDLTIKFLLLKMEYELENEVDLSQVSRYSKEIDDLLDRLDDNYTELDESEIKLQNATNVIKTLLELGDYSNARLYLSLYLNDRYAEEDKDDLPRQIDELFAHYGINIDLNHLLYGENPRDKEIDNDLRKLYYQTSKKKIEEFSEVDVQNALRVIEMAQNDVSLYESTISSVIAKMYYKIALYLESKGERDEAIDTLKKAFDINKNSQTRTGINLNGEIIYELFHTTTEEAKLRSYNKALMDTFHSNDVIYNSSDIELWLKFLEFLSYDENGKLLISTEDNEEEIVQTEKKKKKKKKRKKRKKGRR